MGGATVGLWVPVWVGLRPFGHPAEEEGAWNTAASWTQGGWSITPSSRGRKTTASLQQLPPNQSVSSLLFLHGVTSVFTAFITQVETLDSNLTYLCWSYFFLYSEELELGLFVCSLFVVCL